MNANDRPLSALINQGWEIQDYSYGYDHSVGGQDCFLLRRQKQHKVLKIRKKTFGGGYVVKELDL